MHNKCAGNNYTTAVLTHVFLGQHRVQILPSPLQFAGPTFHTVHEERHEQSAGKGSGSTSWVTDFHADFFLSLSP